METFKRVISRDGTYFEKPENFLANGKFFRRVHVNEPERPRSAQVMYELIKDFCM